jgi:stress-induced morphogen
MAKGTLNHPAYVDQLTAALQRGIAGAQVTAEHVRRQRYRFVVVSPRFKNLGHPERQRMVWDIADRVLNKPDLLNVAMIMTVAPAEMA